MAHRSRRGPIAALRHLGRTPLPSRRSDRRRMTPRCEGDLVNTDRSVRALMQIEKRAERADDSQLVETFVDTGSVFASLLTPSNQIVYGRRGTGKTHAIRYLGTKVLGDNQISIYLSLDHIGSTAGLYADPGTDLALRATRLLVDVITTLHEGLFEYFVNLDEIPSEALAASDALCEAITQVRVEGPVTVETNARADSSSSSGGEFDLTVSKDPALSIRASDSSSHATSVGRSVSATGTALHRVHLGETQAAIRRLATSLPTKRIWFLLDEWSSIPIDLQPYLADMLRRALLNVPKITVKIAAIEYRSLFRISSSDGAWIGAEVGADIFADLNLDDYMVFNSSADRSSEFFNQLLYRHVGAVLDHPMSLSEFNSSAFTEVRAIRELARAAEGVPRDAINIASKAAQRVYGQSRPIGVPEVRSAADDWFQQDKSASTNGNPSAQDLLAKLRDEVIGHRQARAFLLRQDQVRDPVIQQLIDSRVLHLIKRGYSAQDEPGVRYDVLQIDYGCYVNLMRTSKEPKGLLPLDGVDASGADVFVDVPPDDMRSIRRAILRLESLVSDSTSSA